MIRHKVKDTDRDHIVHILPDLRVYGCYSTALTISQALQKQYSHTLLYESSLNDIHPELLWQAQAAGMSILQADITPELLDKHDYTAAILYNVQGHAGVGAVVPSIYYSYGVYDTTAGGDVVVACSAHACRRRRYADDSTGPNVCLDPTNIIPPLVNTRALRRIRVPAHPFTVGVFTSGAYEKYPSRAVIQLLSKLPANTRLLLSTLDRYPHPGVTTALEDRIKRYPGTLVQCPVRPLATVPYMAPADVVLYASAEAHEEPYGRLVVEALAMGKPVICERKGVFKETLKHGVDALLYDNIDEALGYVEQIRNDREIVGKLGTNAQMRASWEDVSVHIGKLKRTLRMIGA